MDVRSTPSRDMGLQFFGKVSASISHEMKNVLAIINENVGLLEDLAYIAEKGKPIDPERLKRTCGNMIKQIQRGDGIMKNLNAFAHSIDETFAKIDLYHLAKLVTVLAERRAAMHRVTIEVTPPREQIFLKTDPFLLENILWLLLEMAVRFSAPGTILRLCPGKNEAGPFLKIEGSSTLEESEGKAREIIPAEMLLQLGITLATENNGQEFLLTFDQP